MTIIIHPLLEQIPDTRVGRLWEDARRSENNCRNIDKVGMVVEKNKSMKPEMRNHNKVVREEGRLQRFSRI